jgi:cell division protease FtsH
MVREFGMSSVLGPVGFAPDGPAYIGHEVLNNKSYAEATQRVIDEEVTRFLREAEQRATDLLQANMQALTELTRQLIEHETVDGNTVYELLTEAPQGV